MFDRLQYQNTERTVIAGYRGDGTMQIIEPSDGPIWDVAVAGPVDLCPSPLPEVIEAARLRMQLTFAQLLIGLVSEGWITEAEGDGWATGNGLPAAVQSAVATLPEAERFPARARLYRMSVAMRSDPMVAALATADGRSPSEIDAFFLTHSA